MLSNFKNELRGCGPFLHDDPRSRPPEMFDNEVTRRVGPDQQNWVMLHAPVHRLDNQSEHPTGRHRTRCRRAEIEKERLEFEDRKNGYRTPDADNTA